MTFCIKIKPSYDLPVYIENDQSHIVAAKLLQQKVHFGQGNKNQSLLVQPPHLWNFVIVIINIGNEIFSKWLQEKYSIESKQHNSNEELCFIWRWALFS